MSSFDDALNAFNMALNDYLNGDPGPALAVEWHRALARRFANAEHRRLMTEPLPSPAFCASPRRRCLGVRQEGVLR